MKPFYNKMLVPVDGSPHATLACQHAVALARQGGSELVLLYCFGEIPRIIAEPAKVDLIHAFEHEAQKLLAPFEQLCTENGITYKSLMRPGAPGRTIVQTCKDELCDIIVMGSRGLSDFSGMVMGSCSHRVLRHAPVPVLIVR